MSEQVDIERSEETLFLLECDKRREPWEQVASLFGEGIRRSALPPGSGGREVVGELENTSAPRGLQLRLLRAGMGILGDTEVTPGEEDEQPLGTSTTLWETSSSELESSEDGEKGVGQNKRIVIKGLGNVMKHVKHRVEKNPSPLHVLSGFMLRFGLGLHM